jgi:DNA-binding XRE family transcriptional regulator
MDILLDIIIKFLPTVIVSLFIAWFNKRQAKREKKHDHQAEIRRKESLLQLQMQAATADLSRATAVALKTGKVNGEVEDGLAAYTTAKRCYFEFLNEQALDHIAGAAR